jgi:hypothetical protein
LAEFWANFAKHADDFCLDKAFGRAGNKVAANRRRQGMHKRRVFAAAIAITFHRDGNGGSAQNDLMPALELPVVTLDEIRRVHSLIPQRRFETISARSDKLAIEVIRKFLGTDWIAKHITFGKGFFRDDKSTAAIASLRMRRVVLGEMLYNFQGAKGFRNCWTELRADQVESAYASMEIGRMLITKAMDPALTFEFVTPSGVKRQDYDLAITLGDGTQICAETKCKMEDTKITIRTLEASFSEAKRQLPEDVPGIIFVKYPRTWVAKPSFVDEMRALASRVLERSPAIVSIKFYSSHVVEERDPGGTTQTEIVEFEEHSNPSHRFSQFADRNWNMFPTGQFVKGVPQLNYNGLPSTWKRLIVGRGWTL